jgi:hypothetical protein
MREQFTWFEQSLYSDYSMHASRQACYFWRRLRHQGSHHHFFISFPSSGLDGMTMVIDS